MFSSPALELVPYCDTPGAGLILNYIGLEPMIDRLLSEYMRPLTSLVFKEVSRLYHCLCHWSSEVPLRPSRLPLSEGLVVSHGFPPACVCLQVFQLAIACVPPCACVCVPPFVRMSLIKCVCVCMFQDFGRSVDHHHSFLVQYKTGADVSLDMHIDDAEVRPLLCVWLCARVRVRVCVCV